MSSGRATGRGIALALLLLGGAALAEVRTGEKVIVEEGEVIAGNLYAAGSRVEIRGTVEGDVVVGAGQFVSSGTVNGDVLGGAGSIQISGVVKGSVRIGGGSVQLSGQIGEDVLAATGQLILAADATVQGELIAAGGELTIASDVAGPARLAGGKVVLDGDFARDVWAEAGQLTVGDGAVIAGALRYGSQETAEISQSAKVGERIEHPAAAERRPAGWLVSWLRALVAFSALGLLLGWLAPGFARRVPSALRESPWRSLLVGALFLAAVPAIAALFFLAGALLGGWWLGVLFLAASAILAAAAVPAVAALTGRLVLERWQPRLHPALVLLAGVALLTLGMRVPILGALVTLAVLFLGVGTLLRAGFAQRQTPRRQVPQPEPVVPGLGRPVPEG